MPVLETGGLGPAGCGVQVRGVSASSSASRGPRLVLGAGTVPVQLRVVLAVDKQGYGMGIWAESGARDAAKLLFLSPCALVFCLFLTRNSDNTESDTR